MDTTSFFKSSAGVFQGGGCRAAAFVGAFDEAIRRGVSFTEVAGTSAGSIVAALVGAGASPGDLRTAIDNLDFNAFLRPSSQNKRRGLLGRAITWAHPQFAALLYDQGFYSSSHIVDWINQNLNKLLPHLPHPISFRSLPIPTYIISTDLTRAEAKVWSQTTSPNELVANAVQASCAIPIFFQPVEKRFVDGGLLSNLPTFIFSGRQHSDRPLSTRILAFSLDADEEGPVEWDTFHFLKLLVNTIVDGSQKLQLDQQKNVHIIKIPTGDIKATDFHRMTPTLTQLLIDNGAKATRQFFDEELQYVHPSRAAASVCYGTDELYTHVTGGLDISLDRIVIAEDDTDWVYKLFPSLLCWRAKGVPIQVLLPEHGDHVKHGPYRRKLLRLLGADVTELQGKSSVPIRAYVLLSQDLGDARAIIGVERGLGAHGIEAVLYEGYLDAPAIRSIVSLLDEKIQPTGAVTPRPSIVEGEQDRLLRSLKTVGQYAKTGVSLTLENVPVERMLSLTRFVREYKYKQIHHLIRLYSRNDLPLFASAYVSLSDGKKSILTPPVVEESGENFILVEGSTRATYCRDLGIPKAIRCIVARGVKDPLPSEVVPFRQVRVIGRTLQAGERYKGFNYGHFRSVENKVHPPESLD